MHGVQSLPSQSVYSERVYRPTVLRVVRWFERPTLTCFGTGQAN
jgi:hypothetical protein